MCEKIAVEKGRPTKPVTGNTGKRQVGRLMVLGARTQNQEPTRPVLPVITDFPPLFFAPSLMGAIILFIHIFAWFQPWFMRRRIATYSTKYQRHQKHVSSV